MAVSTVSMVLTRSKLAGHVLTPRERRLIKPRTKLRVDDVLHKNEAIFSSDGNYRLMLHERGDLILHTGPQKTQIVWRTGTTYFGSCRAIIREDGNLLLLAQDGGTIWESRSGGRGGTEDSILTISNDGFLIISSEDAGGKGEIKEIWKSDQKINQDRLEPGQTLTDGQSLLSPNGRIQLAFANEWYDKRFPVLKDWDKEIWSLRDTKSTTMIMQNNGNLVVFKDSETDSVVWETDTGQGIPSDAKLMVVDEGAIVIKADGEIIWSSHPDKVPAVPPSPRSFPTPTPIASRMTPGMYLQSGMSMLSQNGQFQATFHADAVWTIRRTTTNKIVWKSPNSIAGGHTLCLTYTGNLLLFDAQGKVLWTTKTNWDKNKVPYKSGYSLVLDDDGYLFLQGLAVENYAWNGAAHLRNPAKWSSSIWLPASRGEIDRLQPGQALSVDQSIGSYRNKEQKKDLEFEFGFTPRANFYIRSVHDQKTTYFYTGSEGQGASLLVFSNEGANIIDEQGQIMWSFKIVEPNGRSYSERWLDDPPVIGMTIYGCPVIRWSDHQFWCVLNLPSGSTPEP
ncbi:hypothetical protein GGI42DRAFT_367914 [Trichoderma sp. SZMC 28013]